MEVLQGGIVVSSRVAVARRAVLAVLASACVASAVLALSVATMQ